MPKFFIHFNIYKINYKIKIYENKTIFLLLYHNILRKKSKYLRFCFICLKNKIRNYPIKFKYNVF